jgi:hypothetical protein
METILMRGRRRVCIEQLKDLDAIYYPSTLGIELPHLSRSTMTTMQLHARVLNPMTFSTPESPY